MGIGPLNYGGAGLKKGVHGCGTPMKKIYNKAQKETLMAVGGKFGDAIAKQNVE